MPLSDSSTNKTSIYRNQSRPASFNSDQPTIQRRANRQCAAFGPTCRPRLPTRTCRSSVMLPLCGPDWLFGVFIITSIRILALSSSHGPPMLLSPVSVVIPSKGYPFPFETAPNQTRATASSPPPWHVPGTPTGSPSVWGNINVVVSLVSRSATLRPLSREAYRPQFAVPRKLLASSSEAHERVPVDHSRLSPAEYRVARLSNHLLSETRARVHDASFGSRRMRVHTAAGTRRGLSGRRAAVPSPATTKRVDSGQVPT